MSNPAIPPIVTWANSADEREISSWIVERLHGRDRRWPEADDGFAPLSHLVALVVRHSETSPLLCAVIVKEVIRHIRSTLPEWAAKAEGVAFDTVAGGWTAPALADLLYLSAEILESRARRGEVRNLLVQTIPHLPKRAGGIPLRARAMAVLVELGGHPDKAFWLAQLSDDQPEALPIAFLGMAKHDLDEAMAWLGGRTLEVQGDVIRKLRPTLVKMAGGEIPFVILARQHLFRSDYSNAKDLRALMAPIGDQALYLREQELPVAQAYGGRVLPQPLTAHPCRVCQKSPFIVIYTTERDEREAASALACKRFMDDFPDPSSRPKRLDLIEDTILNYVRSMRVEHRDKGIMREIQNSVRANREALVADI
jgi:hypothetical protein